MTDGLTDLKPLAGKDGDPVFDEQWQAQALAIADSLVQSGLFSASSWSETLGQALVDAGSRGDADDHETYYRCVLSSLETLIAANSEIDRGSMDQKQEDWEAAYLSTPHGQPVFLKQQPDSDYPE